MIHKVPIMFEVEADDYDDARLFLLSGVHIVRGGRIKAFTVLDHHTTVINPGEDKYTNGFRGCNKDGPPVGKSVVHE